MLMVVPLMCTCCRDEQVWLKHDTSKLKSEIVGLSHSRRFRNNNDQNNVAFVMKVQGRTCIGSYTLETSKATSHTRYGGEELEGLFVRGWAGR